MIKRSIEFTGHLLARLTVVGICFASSFSNFLYNSVRSFATLSLAIASATKVIY